MDDLIERGYRIGHHTIRLPEGSIDGPGGVVHVELRIIDVLNFLASHRGEVISRERLHREVWPDSFVCESRHASSAYCAYLRAPSLDATHQFTLSTSKNIALKELDFDFDEDGLSNCSDVCVAVSNPDQRDTDGDGFGNLCDADLNDDCTVNAQDLGIMKSMFFTSDADADFDGNGSVNVIDLGIIKSSFFRPPGPSGVPNVCDGN